jgi:hypothetical protein
MSNELDQLNAFLSGGSTSAPSSELAALNNFLSPKKNNMSGITAASIGFNRGVENLTHGAMQPLLESGLFGENLAQGSKAYAKEREENFQDAAKAYPITANVGNVLGSIGASIPAFLIPGAKEKGLIGLGKNVLSGALGGGLIGASQYVGENESRLFNGALGATLGSAFPVAFAGANKLADSVISPLLSPKTAAVSNILKQGIDPNAAIATKAAADRIGVQLTPAEASGSPLAGQAQGRLGTSPEGGLTLQNFGEKRLGQEKAAITSLFDDIANPNLSSLDANPSELLRNTSQNIIKKETKALQEKAKPLYEKAYQDVIPDENFQSLLDEPIIARSVSKIKTDPLYKTELSNVPENSVKFLDLVKQNIDDQISIAKRSGENNAVRLLSKAKAKLVSSTDAISPDYQLARSIFGEGAKPLQQLNASNIGKIANLKDTQLKQVSKIIFDASQTDNKVLSQIRTRITKENPEAWRRITRNWMEESLDNTSGTGSAFYQKILKSDRKFNQAVSAVQDIPGAAQKLSDMRETFKNLINPVTPRTSAKLAKSSLDVPRSSIEAIKNYVTNLVGGRYDKAAIDLITNPQWNKEITKIRSVKDPYLRGQQYASILGKISASYGTNGDENA